MAQNLEKTASHGSFTSGVFLVCLLGHLFCYADNAVVKLCKHLAYILVRHGQSMAPDTAQKYLLILVHVDVDRMIEAS